MTKTFYITYWADKHKKHITRRGKHGEKSRFDINKETVDSPYWGRRVETKIEVDNTRTNDIG